MALHEQMLQLMLPCVDMLTFSNHLDGLPIVIVVAGAVM
jgi:hypothetical protein